ncbi:hypothetical protein [Streptosporangium vulgare]|uniref:hypothetical protein n=1 Tax=Streptosporangium vulgare TaxID=46190 RepID=UPI0031CE398C
MLVVDDAHLLDDSSAALVHRLALRGRTRLLVTVREGLPVPEDVSRLWKENLLPRVTLAPMTEGECGELLSRAVGGYVDTLTVRRLHRASRGDLRLLRELVVAVHAGGDLSNVSGTWTWRGTPPMTARVRELVEDTIRDVDGEEREALELIASGRPLRLVMSGELPQPVMSAPPASNASGTPSAPPTPGTPSGPTAARRLSDPTASGTPLERATSGEPPDRGAAGTPNTLDTSNTPDTSGTPDSGTAFGVLERLRTKGLVVVDDRLSIRLAHPLHGPVLRAAAKRSGTGGPSGTPRLSRASVTATALADECEELADRAYTGRLSEIPRGTGERIAEDDTGWDEPAMPEFCARRARIARFAGRPARPSPGAARGCAAPPPPRLPGRTRARLRLPRRPDDGAAGPVARPGRRR